MKNIYECKVRKGAQLVGVLTAVDSSVEIAWAYFEKESRRLGGVISDFKCLSRADQCYQQYKKGSRSEKWKSNIEKNLPSASTIYPC